MELTPENDAGTLISKHAPTLADGRCVFPLHRAVSVNAYSNIMDPPFARTKKQLLRDCVEGAAKLISLFLSQMVSKSLTIIISMDCKERNTISCSSSRC